MATQTAAPVSEDIRRAQEVFALQRAARWRVSQTSADERREKLRSLADAIWARRAELHKALHDDFRKNPAEADLAEVFPVLSEIEHAIKHLDDWMSPKRVPTPLALFGTRGTVRLEPKGLVLILAPWNYPFNLAMCPVVAAMAAGNCVVLRPSGKTPATGRFMASLIGDLFDPSEAAVIEGGHALSDALLRMPFDHFFFTGSTRIGQQVMEAAAKHSATVTLELGGKSPVIIDETADIPKAAERVMWGKFLNLGQTCVAPDYVLIHESVEGAFVAEAKAVVERRFGSTEEARRASTDLCRIVNRPTCESLSKILEESLAKGAQAVIGGKWDAAERWIAPTLLTGVTQDSPIMRDEIFGPILPVLTFKDLDAALEQVRARPKPLALYLFSRERRNIERILRGTTAGGTCVNTCVIHLANGDLPFGGVGASGQGNYHGYFGFRQLSHERAVLEQGPLDLLSFFYPPYSPKTRRLIELAARWLA